MVKYRNRKSQRIADAVASKVDDEAMAAEKDYFERQYE